MSARRGVRQASHKPAPPPVNADFSQAACVDTDPEIFFTPEHYGLALSVCAGCPVNVKRACRQLRGSSTTTGVWGGRIYEPRPTQRRESA